MPSGGGWVSATEGEAPQGMEWPWEGRGSWQEQAAPRAADVRDRGGDALVRMDLRHEIPGPRGQGLGLLSWEPPGPGTRQRSQKHLVNEQVKESANEQTSRPQCGPPQRPAQGLAPTGCSGNTG